jgi:hypothetical protein
MERIIPVPCRHRAEEPFEDPLVIILLDHADADAVWELAVDAGVAYLSGVYLVAVDATMDN